MAEVDTRSWWTEVEHLREPMERRSDARRTERRVSGERPAERRTIRIRGQAVPGAPRRELRDVEQGRPSEPYDAEAQASASPERLAQAPKARPRRAHPRRPAPRPRERIGSRPDRIAGWAVLFVLFMALIAATSAHGATMPPSSRAPALAARATAQQPPPLIAAASVLPTR